VKEFIKNSEKGFKQGCNLPRKLTESQNIFEMPQEKYPANEMKNESRCDEIVQKFIHNVILPSAHVVFLRKEIFQKDTALIYCFRN
jgi:hypothetical protein